MKAKIVIHKDIIDNGEYPIFIAKNTVKTFEIKTYHGELYIILDEMHMIKDSKGFQLGKRKEKEWLYSILEIIKDDD